MLEQQVVVCADGTPSVHQRPCGADGRGAVVIDEVDVLGLLLGDHGVSLCPEERFQIALRELRDAGV